MTFKRKLKGITTGLLITLLFFNAIVGKVIQPEEVTRGTIGIIIAFIFIPLLALIVITIIAPDDFEYIIRVKAEKALIVFEMSENYIALRKSFTIMSKNWQQIVLTDGDSKISISYNKEVLKFLESVKES